MKANSKSVKMNYKGAIKRSSLPETFSELKIVLSKTFNINNEEVKSLNISYMDDEGDTVLISDEFDYSQAKIFMEKDNVECLKVTIHMAEPAGRKDSKEFEMINGPTKFESPTDDKLDFTLEKKESVVSHMLDDIVIQSMNEMRLSTELAKSEVNRFVNDSNVENECKELVKNMEQVVIEEVNTKKVLGKKRCKKSKNSKDKESATLGEKILDKCKVVGEKIKEKAIQLKNIAEKEVAKLSKKEKVYTTKDQAKIKIRHQIKVLVDKRIGKLRKNILQTAYKQCDLEIEKIFAQQQVDEIKFSAKPNEALHSNVACDGCDVFPIVGSRYKCAVCEDFDFCEKCEESNSTTHAHPFIKIRNPNMSPTQIISIINDDVEEVNANRYNKFGRFKDQLGLYADKVVDFEKNFSEKINQNIRDFQEKVMSNNKINELKNFDPTKFLEFFNPCVEKNQTEIKNLCENYVPFSSTCLNDNFIIEAVNNTNEIRKNIKLLNNGTQAWPKPCYFSCISEQSQVVGSTNLLKVRVEPGKEINVEICLNLKNITQQGEWVSVWQLHNENKVPFGNKFYFIVNVKFTNEIVINKEYVELPKEIFVKQVKEIKPMTTQDFLRTKEEPKKEEPKKEEKIAEYKPEFKELVKLMRMEYDLKGISDKNILYAIVMANGNCEVALDHLFNRSSICDYKQKKFI